MAPNEALKGDLVCVIYGCSVPLVLRRVRERVTKVPGDDSESTGRQEANQESSVSIPDDEKLYTLIGECYVGHMMDSEAITYAEDQWKPTQTFTLM